VVRSFCDKVLRGVFPLERPVGPEPLGRPIVISPGAIPPLTVYEAKSLNGAPATHQCIDPRELKQRLKEGPLQGRA